MNIILRFAVMLLALWACQASAQVPIVSGDFSPWPPRFNPWLPDPRTGQFASAPNVSVSGSASGVSVAQSGSATVTTASGVKVQVPVSTTATIGKPVLVRAARLAVRGLGVAGLAYTGYEIYQALQTSGVTTCGPPDIFCYNEKKYTHMYWCQGNSYCSPTPQEGCAKAAADAGLGGSINGGTVLTASCLLSNTGRLDFTAQCWPYYPNGSQAYLATNIGGAAGCANSPTTTKPRPFTDAELDAELEQKMTAENMPGFYRSFHKDFLLHPVNPLVGMPDILPPSSPVVVNAPPVTTPQQTISERTYPNPDGTTTTEKKDVSVTVTPTPSGGTVGDSKIEFKAKETFITTTVNNTTNETNISTEVVTPPAPAAEVPKLEIPNDYNKEVTQQAIQKELSGEGAKAMPDQATVIADAKTKSETDLKTARDAVEAAVSQDKSGFFSWVWTPPVGACAPNTGTVGGHAISWDLCPTVNNIRDVLGWLLALFSAIVIYGQIFKGHD